MLEQSLKETGKGHASDFLPESYREADGREKNVTFNGLKWHLILWTTFPSRPNFISLKICRLEPFTIQQQTFNMLSTLLKV